MTQRRHKKFVNPFGLKVLWRQKHDMTFYRSLAIFESPEANGAVAEARQQ